MVAIEIDELGSNSHGNTLIDLVLIRSTRSMPKVAYLREILPNSLISINSTAWFIDSRSNWWPLDDCDDPHVAGDDALGLPP